MRAKPTLLLAAAILQLTSAISPLETESSQDKSYVAFATAAFTSAVPFPTPPPDLSAAQLNLLRRQTIAISASASTGTCPASYLPCTGNGVGLCCRQGTFCTNDQANHIACCPTSALCTGTISVGSQSGSVGSSSSAVSSGVSSSGFLVPAGATTAGASAQGSTVSNQYYAFAVLPTSFSNAAACSSGFSSCATEYQKCTNALGGNANALTIGGGGAGGVTVPGATVSLGPSATQICASLSQEACKGLQLASCTVYGGSAGLTNPNAAPTKAPGLGIGAMGVMVGMLGHVL